MAGLHKAELLKVGRGYVEASLQATNARIAAQLEAAYRANASTIAYVFARGETDFQGAWAASAGVGVRF